MTRSRLTAAVLGAGLALATGLGMAGAQSSAIRVAGAFYTIETTVAHFNVGSGAFSTQAPVHISRPGLDAFADRADGNAKAGAAVMRGNVRVRDAGGRASPQGPNAEAATLTCDELDVDAKADVYHAVGHARYVTATRSATADTMILNRKRRTLHLAGAVSISDGDTTVRAAVVDADMARHDAVATGTPVIITQPAPATTVAPGTPTPGSAVGSTAAPSL